MIFQVRLKVDSEKREVMNEKCSLMDNWFRKNLSTIQTARDHPQIQTILQNNLKLQDYDNLNKILTGAALNMENLKTLTVSSLETLVEGNGLEV